MAVKAIVIAAAILLLFSLVGRPFLAAMGISLEAFRIFGGLLLFLIALEMVFARESGTRTSTNEQAESRRRADISVFPLAFPLIAGPGALVTILLWVAPVSLADQPLLFAGMALCAALVLVITLAFMLLAVRLMRVIGVTGANVANRLLGVVLGALAVQFVLDGLRSSFHVIG
jgi:multiple antibiotic resistance protein